MSELLLPPNIAEERTRESDLMNRIVFVPPGHPLFGIPLIIKPLPNIVAPGTENDPVQREFFAVWILLHLMATGITDKQLIDQIQWITKDDLEACREWLRKLIKICQNST